MVHLTSLSTENEYSEGSLSAEELHQISKSCFRSSAELTFFYV